MRKYVYENAIVHITEPTEEQLQNIRKATERFAQTLARRGLIKCDQRRDNKRVSRDNSNARKRDKTIKR